MRHQVFLLLLRMRVGESGSNAGTFGLHHLRHFKINVERLLIFVTTTEGVEVVGRDLCILIPRRVLLIGLSSIYGCEYFAPRFWTVPSTYRSSSSGSSMVGLEMPIPPFGEMSVPAHDMVTSSPYVREGKGGGEGYKRAVGPKFEEKTAGRRTLDCWGWEEAEELLGVGLVASGTEKDN
jgi:hypothetical protein